MIPEARHGRLHRVMRALSRVLDALGRYEARR